MPVIAIVDDDDSFRHATMSFIRSLGYAVVQFASAESFLKSDRLAETDCLISDVQMPGMNGLELQRKLIAGGNHLPIIFLTAFPEIKARAQAVAAGAIGFLAKPFNDEMLITCLNEAIGARSVSLHSEKGRVTNLLTLGCAMPVSALQIK
jgi:FixJ family two-component response regulator